MADLEEDESRPGRRLQATGFRLQQNESPDTCCLTPDAFPHLRFTLYIAAIVLAVAMGWEAPGAILDLSVRRKFWISVSKARWRW